MKKILMFLLVFTPTSTFAQCVGGVCGTGGARGLFSRMFAPRTQVAVMEAPVSYAAPMAYSGCQSQSYSQSIPMAAAPQSYAAPMMGCQSQSYSAPQSYGTSCQSQNYSQSQQAAPQQNHQATPTPPKPQSYKLKEPIVKYADIIRRNPNITLTNHPSLPPEEEPTKLEPIDERIIQEYIEPKVYKETADDGSIWEDIDQNKLKEKIKEINKLIKQGNGGKSISFK